MRGGVEKHSNMSWKILQPSRMQWKLINLRPQISINLLTIGFSIGGFIKCYWIQLSFNGNLSIYIRFISKFNSMKIFLAIKISTHLGAKSIYFLPLKKDGQIVGHRGSFVAAAKMLPGLFRQKIQHFYGQKCFYCLLFIKNEAFSISWSCFRFNSSSRIFK